MPTFGVLRSNSGANKMAREAMTTFQVLPSYDAEYARITVVGAPTIGQLISLTELLAVDSRSWAQPLLLLDLRQVETRFAFTDQFRLGEAGARNLGHLRKLASVVPPDRITHVSEKAANHGGANVRVFTDEAEAVAWLQE